MILFADAVATPNANSFLQLWLSVGMMASVVANIVTIFMMNRKQSRVVGPQPFEVKESHDFAREKDCAARSEEAHRRIEDLRRERTQDMKDAAYSRKSIYAEIKTTNDQTRKHIDEVRSELSQGTADVHARVNDVLQAVSTLAGKIEQMNQGNK